MKKNLLFAAIDVDDKSYHVCVFNPLTSSYEEFSCGPQAELLIRALKRRKLDRESVKICYEASYIGLSLHRKLQNNGFQCGVIAPSLIPITPGKHQKTDRLDSRKLAQFYASGLLTAIYIADAEDEAARDMLRSRRFLVQQQTKIKTHITSMCRRLGLDYKTKTGKKCYWTGDHEMWLRARVKEMKQEATRVNFKILLKQYQDITENISLYESEAEHIASTDRFKRKVKALCCFKGVSTIGALTLVSELGDIRRFDHPHRITSYAGFDLVEYSSGGKEKKFGISKFGNPHLRRVAVDSVMFALRSPTATAKLKRRRQGCDPEVIATANRCSRRLFSKGNRLLHAGKNRNKVRVACAREFLGFVWEALNKAA